MVVEIKTEKVETPPIHTNEFDSMHCKDLGVVIRFTKPDHKITPILKEYDGIGFARLGGKIKKRNASEQLALISQCEKAGICIPRPVAWVENNQAAVSKTIDDVYKSQLLFRLLQITEEQNRTEAVVYPFVPGVALSDFLQEPAKDNKQFQTKLMMVAAQMQDLIRTHRFKIIMGDRWGPNQIVVANQLEKLDLKKPMLAHIDLDLDIRTTTEKTHDPALDFEAAQVIYHLAFWTHSSERERVINYVIKPMWKIYQKNINLTHFKELLEGHIKYFREHDKTYALAEGELLVQSLYEK